MFNDWWDYVTEGVGMKQFLLFFSAMCFGLQGGVSYASFVKPKHVFCPSEKQVSTAVKNKQSHVAFSMGKWILFLLEKPQHPLVFQRATYVKGEPSCYYGLKKNRSQGKGFQQAKSLVKMLPLVSLELYPAWKGTTGARNQITVKNCEGDVMSCPWKADKVVYAPWSADD